MDARRIASRRGEARRAAAALRDRGAAADAVPAPPPEPPPETYDATDAAAELMAEKRINPFVVVGTGTDGRILKNDVDRYIEAMENR